MADCATFNLRGRVLEYERSLLVGVALDARCIGARVEPCLLRFESAVGVMTITALHHAFEDPVMERLGELRLGLIMTSHAQLRLALNEHLLWRQIVRVRRERTYRDQRGRRVRLS